MLSHRSAAELWQLLEPIEGPVHVTVPHGRRAVAGVRFHWSRDPGPRTRRDAIPITSVTRTLLDLAAVASPIKLRQALEAAERLELLDLAAVVAVCERSGGRRGTSRLLASLGRYGEDPPETRSALEHRFVGFCRRAGLPTPAVNVQIAGLEVDCVWPDRRLVVELDGYAFHRGRDAFERDRQRDANLALAGYTVLRLTDRRLRDEPQTVAGEIRSLLAARRP
jgi:hypothetical protein